MISRLCKEAKWGIMVNTSLERVDWLFSLSPELLNNISLCKQTRSTAAINIHRIFLVIYNVTQMPQLHHFKELVYKFSAPHMRKFVRLTYKKR